MSALTLLVNGQQHVADVDGATPLLWVLRDQLDLTGTKYGCGEGFCGACTVLIDGEPVRACMTTAAEAVGHAITTIEGLAAVGHPVFAAWIAEDVSQCGYCQPGQLLTAAALLARNPRPSDDDISRALGDNLCRCGTYQRIRRAIHRAADREAKR